MLYLYIIKEVANGPVGRQPIMLGNRSGYCNEVAQKSHVVKHIFSVNYGNDRKFLEKKWVKCLVDMFYSTTFAPAIEKQTVVIRKEFFERDYITTSSTRDVK